MADIFDALWQDYQAICPQAASVQALLSETGDQLNALQVYNIASSYRMLVPHA